MEDSVDLDAILAGYVRQFENAEEVTRPAREKSELCRDYFDDKQLTADEEAELRKRGQPAVVFNEIKPKVKTMLGLEKQSRKDPKAYPRNPDDEDSARAATDAIRYVCDDSRWDDKRSAAARNLAIEGTGVVFIGVKQTRSGIDPEIRKVAWDRFYSDPHSADDDFEDAAFLGIVTWMELDDAVRKYPAAKDSLEATWNTARYTETYDDKPKWNLWADYKRKRVRVCEHYCREGGKWMYSLFTKAGFVVEPQPSPYLGDDGEPECPIKAISLYVDRDNNRYGEVQAMLSPQDEINKRRSKSLHIVSQRQVRVSPATGMDAQEIRKELSRPDGVFVGEKDDVEILGTSDMLAGNLNLMMDAREHIHRTGANSALSGKDAAGQSGRAIVALQQGGMTEAADYLDCVRRLSFAVYRSVWCRIRQFWKQERWIRVTDNDSNVRFVGLNQPITALQAEAKKLGVEKANMEQADPQAVQYLQTLAMMPAAQQVVGIENNVGELDVDIIVDEGIDTPTVAAEQFEMIAKMLPGAPPNLQPVLWNMLLMSSALRGKEKIEEAMNQPPSPEQQATQQLQMAGAQAEVEKTQSETVKNYAQAAAADPSAQVQLEREKTGAQLQLETAKAQHGAQMAQEKHEQGMVMGERKQAFSEAMAARQAMQPKKAA